MYTYADMTVDQLRKMISFVDEPTRTELARRGWVETQNGWMDVTMMDDSHLLNAIGYRVRLIREAYHEWDRAAVSLWSLPAPQGDMASYYYEAECDWQDANGGPGPKPPDIRYFVANYAPLGAVVREAARRGIANQLWDSTRLLLVDAGLLTEEGRVIGA